MGYRANAVEPLAARRDLERLWADNLTLESHVADKFAWLYFEAPIVPARVFVLTTDDGHPVGTAGVGVREFQLGAEVGQAGLLADLAVDRAHRSVGPALALVRAGKAYVDEQFALAYGFPNKLAEGVFKRAGYRALGSIERYAMPLRHAAFVDRIDDTTLARVPTAIRPWAHRALRSPTVASAAGVAFDVATLARRVPSVVQSVSRLRIVEAARPDARFDGLWQAARAEYRVIAARTARFLSWRFRPQPERTWHLAIDRSTDALRAYACVDLIDGVAHVRDVFGHPTEVLALLDRLPVRA